MAHALVIEEESGTCRAWVHPHNGYYAGDFSGDFSGDFFGSGSTVSGGRPPRRLRAVGDPPGDARNAAALPAAGLPTAA